MSDNEYPDAPAAWLKDGRPTKVVLITDQAGKERPFLFQKFDALTGRELVAKYPVANMPKLGEYSVSEECMLKLMHFVAALQPDGKQWIPLVSRALYTNHVPDWETGMKIEGASWEFNCSFFANGKASSFFGDIGESIKRSITSMLMDSLAQLSRKDAPP